jgi:hypothetical protein
MERVVLGGGNYITFLKDWEGGTSSRKTDFASRYHTGIHTVKGITWRTFTDLRPNLTYQDFLNMDDNLWYDIYSDYYTKGKWDVALLNELIKKYPLIGYNLIETCWMMGNTGSEALWANFLRKYFKFTSSNITPKQITKFFIEETSNYNVMVQMMYSWRKKYYNDYSLKHGSANLSGWMNRLNNLYYYFAPKLVNNELGIVTNVRKINGLV